MPKRTVRERWPAVKVSGTQAVGMSTAVRTIEPSLRRWSRWLEHSSEPR
jgi:hypothetical protein